MDLPEALTALLTHPGAPDWAWLEPMIRRLHTGEHSRHYPIAVVASVGHYARRLPRGPFRAECDRVVAEWGDPACGLRSLR